MRRLLKTGYHIPRAHPQVVQAGRAGRLSAPMVIQALAEGLTLATKDPILAAATAHRLSGNEDAASTRYFRRRASLWAERFFSSQTEAYDYYDRRRCEHPPGRVHPPVPAREDDGALAVCAELL